MDLKLKTNHLVLDIDKRSIIAKKLHNNNNKNSNFFMTSSQNYEFPLILHLHLNNWIRFLITKLDIQI